MDWIDTRKESMAWKSDRGGQSRGGVCPKRFQRTYRTWEALAKYSEPQRITPEMVAELHGSNLSILITCLKRSC